MTQLLGDKGFDEVCPQEKRQEIPTPMSLLQQANLKSLDS
jgi:hypothetical protein